MSDFEPAIDVVLSHEGGWVDDPHDPGRETNFGISQMIIERHGLGPSDLDIPVEQWGRPGFMKLLKRYVAVELYRKWFWKPGGFEQIADQTAATKVFDFAVNTPPGLSVRLAQLAVGVGVDGQLGPLTAAAINVLEPADFLRRFRDRMVGYYTDLAAKFPEKFRVVLPTGKTWEQVWLARAQWGVPS